MPIFSKTSLIRLQTCHPDLQLVAHEAIKRFDFAVICGYRDKKDQTAAYLLKTSRLKWPHSRHNKMPSEAMDLAPYPIDWADEMRFIELSGVILETAEELGIELTWGGDWDVPDLPHYELTKK